MSATAQPSSCPKCGRPLTALNANFCTYCGTTIQMPALVDDDARHLGETIDNSFHIEATLGVGSMGVVYRANQLPLNKPVAIKILRRAFVTDSVVMERFKREAQAASRLKHPNTINIVHFGETGDGSPYIAMEYLEGTDLSDLVTEEFPLSSKRIVSMMSQACLALQEAHDQGIVHRDLKPANIVVTKRRGEEVIKVLDFGIAKIQDIEGEGLTRDGIVCGTPAFMSPEQVSGLPVDHRSDLFSLGIILYYILSGQLPFSGNSAVEMASAILMDDPKPPSRVRLGARVAPELERVCLRALSKQIDDRYQSANEFRQALEIAFQTHQELGGDDRLESSVQGVVAGDVEADILQGHGVSTVVGQVALVMTPPPTQSSAPKWIIPLLVGIAVVLAVVVVIVVLSNSSGDSPADGATTPDPPETTSYDPNLLMPATRIGLVSGGGVGVLWPTPRSAASDGGEEGDTGFDGDFTNDPDVDLIESGSGLEGDTDGDGELSRSEKRVMKRKKAAPLFAKAEQVWRSDPKKAIGLLEKATRYDRKNAKYWELLGDAYVRVAKRRDAAKAYQKVLEINPDHRRRRIMQKQIEAAGL